MSKHRSSFALLVALAVAAGCATFSPAEKWREASASAQLFEGMGPHRREITTSSPEAQRYFDQGLNWTYAFNHDEAIKAFTKAAELDPGFADAHRNMALAHQALGNTAEAAVSLARVAKLQAGDFRAHFELASFLESQGQFQKAVASYRECLRLNPTFAQGFFHLGRTLARAGSTSDARLALQKALSLNPKHGPAHFMLGGLALQQRQWEEATSHFEAARELGIEIPPEISQKLKTRSN